MSLEDALYPLLSLYQRLPGQVKRGIGAAYRAFPETVRLGRRYAEFRDLARDGEAWPESRIQEYQLAQLRATLTEAGSWCPYYREQFRRTGFDPGSVSSYADIAGCPRLSKRELLEHSAGLCSEHFPSRSRLYLTTGGSTGVPVGFYLHKGVSRPKEQAFLESMWSRAGYSVGARVAVIRGHVTSSRARGPIVAYEPMRDWLMLSSYHLTPSRLADYLEAIEGYQPDFLHAYPSAALQLARFLEEAGQSWRWPLRAVLCGSERLSSVQRQILERVFRCRVYSWYGHSERAVLAGQGASSPLLYFFPQYGYVEFGPPDEDGLREVIGTSFHNHVMPLIRYETGDLVRLADDSERELPWPAVTDVVGRGQEFLVSATGRLISLTAFNMHDSLFDGLYAVQFRQEEPGVAVLTYVASRQFDNSRLDTIARGVRRKLGDDFTMVFRRVDEVEKTARGKHRWLVSSLMTDKYARCDP